MFTFKDSYKQLGNLHWAVAICRLLQKEANKALCWTSIILHHILSRRKWVEEAFSNTVYVTPSTCSQVCGTSATTYKKKTSYKSRIKSLPHLRSHFDHDKYALAFLSSCQASLFHIYAWMKPRFRELTQLKCRSIESDGYGISRNGISNYFGRGKCYSPLSNGLSILLLFCRHIYRYLAGVYLGCTLSFPGIAFSNCNTT